MNQIYTLLLVIALAKQPFEYTIPFTKNATQKLNLTSPYHHLLFTNACIGTPMKCYSLPIHFELYPSWLCGSFHSGYDSLTHTEVSALEGLYTSFTSFISKRSEDIIHIFNNPTFRLNYSKAESSECNKRHIIGELGFGIRPTRSLSKYGNYMEQLLYHNLITQETIAIEYFNATNGEITIGSSITDHSHLQPNPFIELSFQSYSLTELTNQISKISLIRQEEEIIEIDIGLKAMLSYQMHPIIAPLAQYNQITARFLLHMFLSNLCVYSACEENGFKYEMVICNKEVIHRKEVQGKTVELLFDSGEKIEIPLKELFIENGHNYVFGVVGEENYQVITVGDIVMKHYFAFFDRETQKMRMFSLENVNQHKSVLSQTDISIKRIYMTNIILSLIACIICSFLYYHINTKVTPEG